MASLLSVSGLMTGIQWRDMIDQIIELEARPVRTLEAQVTRTETQSTTWSLFKAKLAVLQQAASALDDRDVFRSYKVDVHGAVAAALSVSAGPEASEGVHQVRVLSVATREKLGGAVYASSTAALGLTGEFVVNGAVVRVEAEDSLRSIADKINAVGVGATGAGVTASVLSTSSSSHRLVLSSTKSGAAGIDLVDGGEGVLRQLGLLGEGSAIKHQASAGAWSDAFVSATTAVGEQLGFTVSPAGTVQLGGAGGFSVSLDLATMSLEDVASSINAAAALAGSAITAAVVEDTTGPEPRYRLEIKGTTTFFDSETRVFEALGVLRGARDAVRHEVHSAALASGGVAATGATRIVDLDGGAQAGDTLTLAGTRADGTSFTIEFEIGADTTLDDLATRLSETDAFGGGARPSTATIEDGRVVVRDQSGGESRLALSIVAHNEGGGLLDFGEFTVAQRGYARELARGADAEIEVDGMYVRRSENVFSDAVPGLTFDLRFAAPDQVLDVVVTRDAAPAADAIASFVEAYNAVVDFVAEQLTPPLEGVEPQPLYGDGVLRSMRSQLQVAMQTVLPSELGLSLSRLADVGIQIGVDGRFRLDRAQLGKVLQTDPNAVYRLFAAHGTTTGAGLSFVDGGSSAKAGTYAVEITQPATRAEVVSSFGGVYVDDAEADRLIITETGTGAAYSILLENGMTAAEIVQRLNDELGTATQHRLALGHAWTDDQGSPVTDATVWADVRRADGTPVALTDGLRLTISGTRHNGTSFVTEYVIQHVATSTVGELRSLIQSQIGGGATVSFDEVGRLVVERTQTGASQISLAISTDDPDAAPLFGALDVVTEGRRAAAIRAYEEDGQMRIQHEAYGSHGFELAYEAGGADGTASLGLAAGSYTGVDVTGTIGGHAATGVGQRLIGAEGTPVSGLVLQYDSAATGLVGEVAFGRGVAAAVRVVASALLDGGAGSVDGVISRLGQRTSQLEERIERMEARLERRREQLIARFAALETALAKAQAQSQWLAAQFAQGAARR